MDYFDTSIFVTLLTNEGRRTEAVGKWLMALPLGTRAISPWVVAEYSSAVARKLRIGELDVAGRAEALGQFKQLRPKFRMLPIEAEHFHAAANMVDMASNLRAPDALHLAIARDLGATVWTLDADMAKAAEEFTMRAAIPAL